jgi:hypothetical protein
MRLLALRGYVQTPSSSHILIRPFRSPVPSVHLHTSNRHLLPMTRSKTSLPAPSVEQSSEDAPAVTLDFKEESIGLPPSKGFGFLDVNIGDELGPDGCYVVLRKLGYGVYSNVWLARDKRLAEIILPRSIDVLLSQTRPTICCHQDFDHECDKRPSCWSYG